MAVSQQAAPRNLRVPKITVESRLRVDNPVADAGDLLLIAPKIATGSGIVGDIYTVATEARAEELYGRGSIGHRMFRAWQAQAPFAGVKMLVLADPVGRARAVKFLFARPANSVGNFSGVVSVRIGGDLINIPIGQAVTHGDVVTAIHAVLGTSANTAHHYESSIVSTNTLVLTARNNGTVNNEIGDADTTTPADITVDVSGISPPITATVATFAPGNTTARSVLGEGLTFPPAFSLFSSVGDDLFDLIVLPEIEGIAPNTEKPVQTLLGNRWNANDSLFGASLSVAKGTLAELGGSGYASRGNAYEAVLAVDKSNPTPAYEIAAAAGQQIYARQLTDPVLSYNNLVLNGVGAPKLSQRFPQISRETILGNRLGTVKYDSDGTCRLESVPLTWTPDGGGYYYLSNLYTVQYVGRLFSNLLEQYISNFKFHDASSGEPTPPGAVSLQTIRANCIGIYGQLRADGIVEDEETFIRNLVVDRPEPNRLRVVLPVNIQNAIRSISIVNSWTQ